MSADVNAVNVNAATGTAPDRRRGLRAWWARRDGVVALELALMTAFIIVPLLLGTFEVSRYLLAANKTERVAQTRAQLVARNQSVAEDTVVAGAASFFTAGSKVASPFNINRDGNMTVSLLVNRAGAAPRIIWQIATTAGQSELGVRCATASLPAAIAPILDEAGEFVIVAEVNYTYTPLIWGNLFGSNEGLTTLSNVAFYQPRFATIPPVGPNPGDC